MEQFLTCKLLLLNEAEVADHRGSFWPRTEDNKTRTHHYKGKREHRLNRTKKYSWLSFVNQFASLRQAQTSSPEEILLSTLTITTSTIKKTENHSRLLSNSHINCIGKQAPSLKVVIVLPCPRDLSLTNKMEEPSLCKENE